MERPMLIETEKNKTCVANPTAAVSFGSPSRDIQRSDNRSTAKIAMSPTELAGVITAAGRMVEPSVKTARGRGPGLNGQFPFSPAFVGWRGNRQIFGAVQITISRMTLASAASSAEATAAGSLDGAATLAANIPPPTIRPLEPMIWAEISMI